ncbi:MAG: STAS domain-containing protein [Gordonia polyisoprenivorans]|nr:STAS domain-containing protein [Gordonia polyisoprenivorans]
MAPDHPTTTLTWTTPTELSIRGELDYAETGRLRSAMTGDGDLTVDLGGLTFIDAAALNEFVWATRERVVVLTNVTARISRVFGLAQLAHLLTATP